MSIIDHKYCCISFVLISHLICNGLSVLSGKWWGDPDTQWGSGFHLKHPQAITSGVFLTQTTLSPILNSILSPLHANS
jgi:hypothetical protein